MPCRVMAQSFTLRDIGPMVSMDQTPGIRPYRLTRPQDGLRPTRPHHEAGNRTEPPVSSAREVAHRKAAVAAPDPLLDRPVSLSRSQGFRAMPKRCGASAVANSDMFSFPKRMAPAALSLPITPASSLGMKLFKIGDPPVVRTPWLISGL